MWQYCHYCHHQHQFNHHYCDFFSLCSNSFRNYSMCSQLINISPANLHSWESIIPSSLWTSSISIQVSWDAVLCQKVSESREPLNQQYSVISQKTCIFNNIAVRTSDLANGVSLTQPFWNALNTITALCMCMYIGEDRQWCIAPMCKQNVMVELQLLKFSAYLLQSSGFMTSIWHLECGSGS